MSARISSAASAQACSSSGSSRIAGQLGGPVQRDPAHQLRRHVVLRGPAGLPDPLVRLPPGRDRAFGLGLHQRPQPPRQVLAAAGVQQERVEDRAVHVVLALVERAVADPDRAGALVAGQLVAGRLGQVAPAVDPVHDLQAAVLVRFDVGDELHELVGLPVQVEEVQGLEGEGGVPHPGVAVVPVPLAARGLRQRGRQRRHGGAGRHVGQALDRQRGPLQRVPQRVVGDAGPGQPAAPELGPSSRCAPRRRRRRWATARPSAQDSAQNAARPWCSTCRARAELPSMPDRQVGAQPERLAGSRGVGGVALLVDQRPLGGVRGRSRRPARRPARPRPSRPGTRPCGPAGARRRRRPAAGCAAWSRPDRGAAPSSARRGPAPSHPACARWSSSRSCPGT